MYLMVVCLLKVGVGGQKRVMAYGAVQDLCFLFVDRVDLAFGEDGAEIVDRVERDIVFNVGGGSGGFATDGALLPPVSMSAMLAKQPGERWSGQFELLRTYEYLR